MAEAHARSCPRAIGVSNVDADELEQVIAAASVAPVADQVQFNPSAYRRGARATCTEPGVALEAYSPLPQLPRSPCPRTPVTLAPPGTLHLPGG
jgi:diketogulonate reductase-like aldo/keto reductase